MLFMMMSCGFAAAQANKHITSYIGLEATNDILQELLGPVYEYDKSKRQYNRTYGLHIKCGVHKHPTIEGQYIEKINEIYMTNEFMEEPPVDGSIIYGLKVGERYEKCEKILAEHSSVTYVETTSDLNGQIIKFGYERPDGSEVPFHLRFRPKKSKWYMVAMYIKQYSWS